MNSAKLTRNAIIIGASSGIGAALALELSRRGYAVGLAARRMERLNEIAGTLANKVVTRRIDVSDTDDAMTQLQSMVEELGDIELFVISSGVGHENPDLTWELERETIATNAFGFAAVANVCVEQMMKQRAGTLVGITSIAAIRGNGGAPAYGATKAFASHYLAALRHKLAKSDSQARVLEVQPGFVDTAMAKGEGLFWVASPAKASAQILNAVDRQRSHVYVTRRWRIIAWLLRVLPNFLYNRIS